MPWVSMMDSFTRACRSVNPFRVRRASPCLIQCCLSLVVLTIGQLLVAAAAWADAPPLHISQFQLERSDQGVFLSAQVELRLPAAVEDAARRGVPLYFVAEADLRRERWYWYDSKVASVRRYLRLAFQPLTRRWRINMAAEPMTSAVLGVSLAQSHETLEEALSAIGRFSRWRIADAGMIEPGARYGVEFRFALDVSQLPRPFQIGTAGQSDWSLAVTRSERLPEDAR